MHRGALAELERGWEYDVVVIAGAGGGAAGAGAGEGAGDVRDAQEG